MSLQPAVSPARALRWPSLLLGLAIGGFFDGILLHQILQWHHLLSNVDAVKDLRSQVLADGVFHALMYLVAGGALALLWRRRAALPRAGSGRDVAGCAIAGFGAWHVLDTVLSHWITGIHRIRVDAPNPLLWDLLWVVVFGLVPIALGASVLRRGGTGGGRATAASLAIVAGVAGPVAALPAGGEGDRHMVAFAPWVSPGAAFHALARVDARVVWVDASGGLWAVRLPDRRAAWQLHREGALLVSNGAIAFGCLPWSTVGRLP